MRKSIEKSVLYLIGKNIPEYEVAKLQLDINSINGILIKNNQNFLRFHHRKVYVTKY